MYVKEPFVTGGQLCPIDDADLSAELSFSDRLRVPLQLNLDASLRAAP